MEALEAQTFLGYRSCRCVSPEGFGLGGGSGASLRWGSPALSVSASSPRLFSYFSGISAFTMSLQGGLSLLGSFSLWLLPYWLCKGFIVLEVPPVCVGGCTCQHPISSDLLLHTQTRIQFLTSKHTHVHTSTHMHSTSPTTQEIQIYT